MKKLALITTLLLAFSTTVFATDHSPVVSSTFTGTVGTGVNIAAGIGGSVGQISTAGLSNFSGVTPVSGTLHNLDLGVGTHDISIPVSGYAIGSQTIGVASSSLFDTYGAYGVAGTASLGGWSAVAHGSNIVTIGGTTVLHTTNNQQHQD